MENKIECYVFGGYYSQGTYIPARVVGESKATITVAVTRNGNEDRLTFQKRKQYGVNEYDDPRTHSNMGNDWYMPSIDLRGETNSVYATHLTFAVEKVQKRIESTKLAFRREAVEAALKSLRERTVQLKGVGYMNGEKLFDSIVVALTNLEEELAALSRKD